MAEFSSSWIIQGRWECFLRALDLRVGPLYHTVPVPQGHDSGENMTRVTSSVTRSLFFIWVTGNLDLPLPKMFPKTTSPGHILVAYKVKWAGKSIRDTFRTGSSGVNELKGSQISHTLLFSGKGLSSGLVCGAH